MRSRRASKSRPPAPTMTISPSTTERSGRAAARGATSSGKYRFIGFSSRLCSRTSSPSRNTRVRNPSHLGSNCQPSPPGRASAAFDSMGARGGGNGSRVGTVFGARLPRAITLDDEAPQDTALASIVVAVRPVHGRAVVDDQHVALAPRVVVDDLGPDHPGEQIAHVGAARLRSHAVDVGGLGDVEVHRARAVYGMRAHHRMRDRLAVLLSIFGARVGVVTVQAVERP